MDHYNRIYLDIQLVDFHVQAVGLTIGPLRSHQSCRDSKISSCSFAEVR